MSDKPRIYKNTVMCDWAHTKQTPQTDTYYYIYMDWIWMWKHDKNTRFYEDVDVELEFSPRWCFGGGQIQKYNEHFVGLHHGLLSFYNF